MRMLQKPLAGALYLRRLTDDTGIFQHTKFGIPDRNHGYTTDDNARALLAAAMLAEKFEEPQYISLLSIYLSFLHHAQIPDGNFRNFMGYSRLFLEERGSEDCLGRCLWALGYTLTVAQVPENMKNTCRYLINQALGSVQSLRSPRAKGYAIIGLSYLLVRPELADYRFPSGHPPVKRDPNERFLPIAEIKQTVTRLADELVEQYQSNKGESWLWFEDIMSYSNSILPWSLLRAYRVLNKPVYLETGTESLRFLADKTFADGVFKPIGCHGWQPRGGEAAPYDEQPIEASEMALACREAYQIHKDDRYRKMALRCLEWYEGKNSLGVSLIDPQSGAVFDGIHSGGVNLNQGSESIVSYLIANMVMTDE